MRCWSSNRAKKLMIKKKSQSLRTSSNLWLILNTRQQLKSRIPKVFSLNPCKIVACPHLKVTLNKFHLYNRRMTKEQNLANQTPSLWPLNQTLARLAETLLKILPLWRPQKRINGSLRSHLSLLLRHSPKSRNLQVNLSLNQMRNRQRLTLTWSTRNWSQSNSLYMTRKGLS